MIGSAQEAIDIIVATRAESDGFVSLEPRQFDGAMMPVWKPGAHIDVMIEGKRSRQYLLIGDPLLREYYKLESCEQLATAHLGSATTSSLLEANCEFAAHAITLRYARPSVYVIIAGAKKKDRIAICVSRSRTPRLVLGLQWGIAASNLSGRVQAGLKPSER